MINWKEIAENSGLSKEEFKEEVYSVASAFASLDIDNHHGVDAVRFICSDSIGKIELIVRRVD